MKEIIESKDNCSRRRLFKMAAIATTMGISSDKTVFGDSDIKKEKPKNMSISIAAYSFREALTKGEMDLFRFIEWCSGIGLKGVELTSYYFKSDSDKNYFRDLRKHAFDNGITISGTAIGNNFCLPSGDDRQKQIDYTKKWIDNSVCLFAPHIRIFSGNLPESGDIDTYKKWVTECLGVVVEYAENAGIVLGLENHGGLTAHADEHIALLKSVKKSPWFGINLDTCNYPVDVYNELAKSAPYAVNVHIKNEVFDDAVKVPADYPKIRNILMEADYKGWIALEYEAKGNPLTEVPKNIKILKELFET